MAHVLKLAGNLHVCKNKSKSIILSLFCTLPIFTCKRFVADKPSVKWQLCLANLCSKFQALLNYVTHHVQTLYMISRSSVVISITNCYIRFTYLLTLEMTVTS